MIYYLIGMMGSGKTTTGKLLASQLDYTFIDTDQLIEVFKQQTIQSIIEEEGLAAFRALEESIFLNMNVGDDAVVSCGGGLITSEKSVKHMRLRGEVIYLKLPIQSLTKRLSETNRKERPLLTEDLNKSLTDIYTARQKLYESTATMTLECDHLTINEVVSQLLTTITIK